MTDPFTSNQRDALFNEVWENVRPSSGRAVVRCPNDGYKMDARLQKDENYRADIAVHCPRCGPVYWNADLDPRLAEFREWTDDEMQGMVDRHFQGLTIRCPVDGTEISPTTLGDRVMLHCWRCGKLHWGDPHRRIGSRPLPALEHPEDITPRPPAPQVAMKRAPSAFASYSWDDEEHKCWVRDLAARLREHGVDLELDRWSVAPGDQLPAFMERAVRENDYVLIVCTPNYKQKADGRKGGVGYEGNIMTGEIFAGRDQRKFIPILRRGSLDDAIPSWLVGKYAIDLRGDPYSDGQYDDLINTLHGTREEAPPLGTRPPSAARRAPAAGRPSLGPEATSILLEAAGSDGMIIPCAYDGGFGIVVGDKQLGEVGDPEVAASLREGVRQLTEAGLVEARSGSGLIVTHRGYLVADALKVPVVDKTEEALAPIRILGVIADEVGTPRDDGTSGSALYRVPFRLSRAPSNDWARLFVATWDNPPSYSMMHRPGIARVFGDRIILDGTTIEEIERFHRDTLRLVVERVNGLIAEFEAKRRRQEDLKAERERQHKRAVDDASKRIKFD